MKPTSTLPAAAHIQYNSWPTYKLHASIPGTGYYLSNGGNTCCVDSVLGLIYSSFYAKKCTAPLWKDHCTINFTIIEPIRVAVTTGSVVLHADLSYLRLHNLCVRLTEFFNGLSSSGLWDANYVTLRCMIASAMHDVCSTVNSVGTFNALPDILRSLACIALEIDGVIRPIFSIFGRLSCMNDTPNQIPFELQYVKYITSLALYSCKPLSAIAVPQVPCMHHDLFSHSPTVCCSPHETPNTVITECADVQFPWIIMFCQDDDRHSNQIFVQTGKKSVVQSVKRPALQQRTLDRPLINLPNDVAPLNGFQSSYKHERHHYEIFGRVHLPKGNHFTYSCRSGILQPVSYEWHYDDILSDSMFIPEIT